ncbi:MAG: CrcB family protein [Planctomycetaceae bacterium]|jgi:CrcB protein|nr:CrcB family protein [Planctomycetaceae bacterium]
MYIQIIGIAAAGAIGTIVRYGITRIAAGFFVTEFFIGTLIVNLLGAMLFGLIIGLITNGIIHEYWKTIILTGFLGGFTTFSAFAYENYQLWNNQKYLYFLINIISQNVLGIAAIILGLFLAGLITTQT